MNRIGSQALRQSVQSEAGSGTTVGAVNIAALAPGSYLRGQTGYTVTIPLVSGSRQLTITSTAIQFVHGRFVHQLTFNGNGVAFPALLQVHLTQLAEARS
jgi:FtsP/CotA-like multicopper oxidase with cupredoxin domain